MNKPSQGYLKKLKVKSFSFSKLNSSNPISESKPEVLHNMKVLIPPLG